MSLRVGDLELDRLTQQGATGGDSGGPDRQGHAAGYLMANSDASVPSCMIIQACWDESFEGINIVDVYVRHFGQNGRPVSVR